MEVKYKNDLEREIDRLRSYEVSQIRLDERQKYNMKVQSEREELERVHLEKKKELKQRENEMMERVKQREREMDRLAFEGRQKIEKEQELLQVRE